MNTLVPGAPAAVADGPGTSPIALGRSRQTTVPAAQAQPLTQEAVLLGALHEATEVTKAVRIAAAGRGGPWVVALLVALVAVSGGLWAAHALTGDRDILARLEALEDAQDDREAHDQWVVLALQALSESKPLPPYPVPRRRRTLDR